MGQKPNRGSSILNDLKLVFVLFHSILKYNLLSNSPTEVEHFDFSIFAVD